MLSTEVLANVQGMNTFKTMLISIVLEAMPFLLLGVVVSSLMQVYIPEQWIKRFIPKNPILGVLVASFLGILFPVCECGLIPVVRRLIAKGMPLYAGVAFFLAGPIVNPVVYSATFVAFRTNPEMVYARMGLAIAVSACIGLIIYLFVKRNPLKDARDAVHAHHTHGGAHSTKKKHKLQEAIQHGGGEFFDMGKYLILGSFITALIQAFIPRSELIDIGQGEYTSHLFMIGFAYILSLCSTADAFVAASFMSTFSATSLLTFLVFGPMIDLKGTLMLLSAFKARFVILLIVLVAIMVPVGALAVGKFYF
ncbi:permease [Paenibacillus sp. 1011MAR3C5]|uniref:permease n=1 Tax=Paenibacillus sp. 1011MAR3C5 TaxID=1675787 RepID=UPI000E6BFC50|nr:permease [Paenibacillus sp. 1011MAR3C5]RJE87027.1 permease [Paenibacillus sp. 1011MAR3C5]